MAFRKFLTGRATPDAPVEYPIETEETLNRVHGAAPVAEHQIGRAHV
mgnify:CR=1 FL=1